MAQIPEMQKLTTAKFRITITNNQIPKDLSIYNTLNMHFLKPSKAVMTRTASFETNGSDGIVFYKSLLNEIDITGTWRIQFEGVDGSERLFVEVGKFSVLKNLSD